MWPAKISVEPSFVLEKLNRRHAVELFDLVDENRRYLGRWLPWAGQTTVTFDTESFIREAEMGARKNTEVHYAIRYKDEIVGVVGLAKIDATTKIGVMGFWLSERWQGFGLMTKACRRLIREAFLRHHLHKIEIKCGVENAKSRGVAERLSFHLDRVAKAAEIIGDVLIDHVVYSLSADDAIKGSAPPDGSGPWPARWEPPA